jgi:hypothetical protein
MISFVLVLRSGGEFLPEHVERLREQIHQHSNDATVFLLTDAPRHNPRDIKLTGPIGVLAPPLMACAPLLHDWPGWWGMLEMFRIPGPAIYLDLDTSIVGDLNPLIDLVETMPENRVLMLNEWGGRRGREMATGVTAWRGHPLKVTTDFADLVARGRFLEPRTYGDGIERAGRLQVDGRTIRDDQQYTPGKLHELGYEVVGIQDLLPGFVRSYKLDLNRRWPAPAGTGIVVFHGKPRPWEIGL